MDTVEKKRMFMMQKQKAKLALLVALEISVTSLTINQKQELQKLTQEFHRCKLK